MTAMPWLAGRRTHPRRPRTWPAPLTLAPVSLQSPSPAHAPRYRLSARVCNNMGPATQLLDANAGDRSATCLKQHGPTPNRARMPPTQSATYFLLTNKQLGNAWPMLQPTQRGGPGRWQPLAGWSSREAAAVLLLSGLRAHGSGISEFDQSPVCFSSKSCIQALHCQMLLSPLGLTRPDSTPAPVMTNAAGGTRLDRLLALLESASAPKHSRHECVVNSPCRVLLACMWPYVCMFLYCAILRARMRLFCASGHPVVALLIRWKLSRGSEQRRSPNWRDWRLP